MTKQYKQLIIFKDNSYYVKKVCMYFFLKFNSFFFQPGQVQESHISQLGTTLWDNKQDNTI